MAISRRFFIKAGTLTAVSTSLFSGSVLRIFGQKRGRVEPDIRVHGRKDLLFYSKRETFEPYVGSLFRVRGALGEALELKLDKVEGYKPNPRSVITTRTPRETESFVLVFSSPGQLPPFLNTHSLYHAALGKLDLFLVPRGTKDGLFIYEAVINHIL